MYAIAFIRLVKMEYVHVTLLPFSYRLKAFPVRNADTTIGCRLTMFPVRGGVHEPRLSDLSVSIIRKEKPSMVKGLNSRFNG